MCCRQQRIFLWSGFIICLIVQMIVLSVTDTKFLVAGNSFTQYDSPNFSNDMVNRCLIFLPCVTFGLAADIQIIVSTCKYKPVAFVDMPYRHTRGFMLVLACLSLAQTVCTYVFCFLVFGGMNEA